MSSSDVKQLVQDRYREAAALWAECFVGALAEADYRAKLTAAGFTGIEIQPTRVFTREEAHAFLASQGLDADRLAPQAGGKVMSAFVRAIKPSADPCGGRRDKPTGRTS